MYEPHLLTPSQERPRSTRSHSLKPISQPNILTQRKRLYSLPSKPVIPPHITIQACQDSSQESFSDEEEQRSGWSHESMGEGVMNLFNSNHNFRLFFLRGRWSPLIRGASVHASLSFSEVQFILPVLSLLATVWCKHVSPDMMVNCNRKFCFKFEHKSQAQPLLFNEWQNVWNLLLLNYLTFLLN